jgi:hypothetical protein
VSYILNLRRRIDDTTDQSSSSSDGDSDYDLQKTVQGVVPLKKGIQDRIDGSFLTAHRAKFAKKVLHYLIIKQLNTSFLRSFVILEILNKKIPLLVLFRDDLEAGEECSQKAREEASGKKSSYEPPKMKWYVQNQ